MKSIYGKYLKIGIIFWAVCFILLLIAYLFILAPQERIRRITDRKLNDTKNLAQSAEEAAEEKNKERLTELITDSEKELKRFVVDPENEAKLTLDISRISNEVKLNAFNSNFAGGNEATRGATRTDNFKHIAPRQITVTFNSSFNKFAFFLNTLERREPVVFVDTFSITRSAENDSNNEVSMKLAFLVGKKS
jgi:hypothetical protein